MTWENEVEITRNADIWEAEILVVGEACKAVFWPTPGFKTRTFGSSSRFSAKGTYILCVRYPPQSFNEDVGTVINVCNVR